MTTALILNGPNLNLRGVQGCALAITAPVTLRA